MGNASMGHREAPAPPAESPTTLKSPDNLPSPFSSSTHLVEENIFSVATLSGKVLQHSVGPNAMLKTQLLPELHADCEG